MYRKMRGGAQAHLMECEDGNFYVVKFRNNPQHRRILINEWISAVFLRHLEIAAPETAIIEITPEFLAANPDVFMQLGSRRIDVEPGWHFGSAFPGDPGRVPVYDYVPDLLIEKVANLSHFLGVLVFDKWMGNADSRQAVFYRARLKHGPHADGFIASMIDHGYVLDGPHWNLNDSPLQGLYFRPIVYQNVRGFTDFEPWLARVVNFPDEVIDDALKQLPAEWVQQDYEALEQLMHRLQARRKRVPDLVRDSSRGRINPFPHWK